MKRTLAFALVLALMLALGLSGCGKKDAGPLRICVDVSGENTSARFDNLIKTMEDYGGPTDVEVEYIPKDGADRESVIKHLKTELMSGSGPDLFIVETYESYWGAYKPMFPIPEQMIERRVFLPLDEYIEKAQFAQWDRLTPKVMEAGRGSEGQMLAPLSYKVLLSCYEGTEFEHTVSAEGTWQDMLADKSGMLRQAGHYWRPGGLGDGITETFTELADYEKEELLFTEEELLETVLQKLELDEAYKKVEWEGLPTCWQSAMTLNFAPENCYFGMSSIESLPGKDPMTIIPQYNREGGVTAKIRSFAAINRNSKRAEDAFFVLDYLLGREAMQYSGLYLNLTGYNDAMPMDLDMGRGELDFNHSQPIAPENLDQFDDIREAITSVSFTNIIDEEMRLAYIDAWNVLFYEGSGISDCTQEAREEIEGIVKEACRVMDMELKES